MPIIASCHLTKVLSHLVRGVGLRALFSRNFHAARLGLQSACFLALFLVVFGAHAQPVFVSNSATVSVSGTGLTEADTTNNTRTDTDFIGAPITLRKALGGAGRIRAADQFVLFGATTNSDIGTPTSDPTTGSGTTVGSSVFTFSAAIGVQYSLNERIVNSPNTPLAAYKQSVSCTNTGPTVVTGPGFTSLPITVTPQRGDNIDCTITNTPKTATLQLSKAWGVSFAGNVANIGEATGGSANTAAFAATAPNPGSSNTVTVTASRNITLPAETMSTGTLGNYNTLISCTANGNAISSTLSGTNGQSSNNTLTINAADDGKAIVCTYTNTRKSSTFILAKAWGANSIAGDIASLGATTGLSNNTTSFTSTASTATSGTPVTAYAGETVTLPAETMPTGTLASYNTVVSCRADNFATDNALIGTNGQDGTNTLLIGAADEGKTITCTYTNTRKSATLLVQIAWPSWRRDSDRASIATTGLINNTGISNSAPPSTDSSAVVTVYAGETAGLKAESFTSGSSIHYDIGLQCLASGGVTNNPVSSADGKVNNTLLIGPGDAGKAIVCTYTNQHKATQFRIDKVWQSGIAGNRVRLSETTTVGRSGATRVIVDPFLSDAFATRESPLGEARSGDVIKLPEETFPSGFGNEANYNSTVSCNAGVLINTNNGVTNGFSVFNELTIRPEDTVVNPMIVCTYTNTLKTSGASLQLRSVWSSNSITGDVANIGPALQGATPRTTAFSSTAPSPANSNLGQVTIGTNVTLPAQTLSGVNQGSYTTALSCMATGGTGTLSGTDGQTSNTLPIRAGDAGKVIICTYTNTLTNIPRPTVTLRKLITGIPTDSGRFNLSVSGGNPSGGTNPASNVGSGGTTGPVRVDEGAAITLTETEGTGSFLSNYATTLSCMDGNGDAVSVSGSGTSQTITAPDAAATGNARNVTCTYTNSWLAALISGKVFLDNGLGAGANDGIFNGGEAGLPGVALKLTDCTAPTALATTLTDGSGNYTLAVPVGTPVGAPLCVEQTNLGARLSTGASVGGTPLPSGTPTSVGGISYTYTRPGTPDKIAFAWNGTGHANLNFGDVDPNTFAADGAKTGLAGNTVAYPHTFTAQTAGSVSFAIASSVASPALGGWSEKIFADVGCTGTLQPGAALLFPPSVPTTVTAAGQQVCIIMQVFIPATAQNGFTNTATVRADFSYANAGPSLSASYTVKDLTTLSSSALELKKEVRNVTTAGSFGVNNLAKSGETLEYRITYTNNGPTPVSALAISDTTPNYTTFVNAQAGGTPPSLTACAKTTPANASPAAQVPCATAQAPGGTGPVRFNLTGTLDPAATGTVLFRVKVD